MEVEDEEDEDGEDDDDLGADVVVGVVDEVVDLADDEVRGADDEVEDLADEDEDEDEDLELELEVEDLDEDDVVAEARYGTGRAVGPERNTTASVEAVDCPDAEVPSVDDEAAGPADEMVPW